MKKLLIIIFGILIHSNLLLSSGESVKIEDYSYKDGLTTSGVYSSFKDSKGFLWLCTLNGLFRYDGYNFKNLNTLIENNINISPSCITEDSDHNFWIGTSTGIIYYNTHIERLIPIKLSLNKSVRCYQILLIKEKIWIASSIGLLVINTKKTFDTSTLFKTRIFLPDSLHKRTPQDKIINTLYYTSGSTSLWVGTNGALYELDINSFIFRLINSYSQNSIRSIAKYNNNIIVSSWDGGVFVVNTTKHIVENDPFIAEVNKSIGDKRSMSAIVDNQGHLWVATFGNGLYIFERSKNGNVTFINFRNDQKQQENLKSDFINQMYIDDTGIGWLCMNQPALSKVFFQKSNLANFNFFKNKNGHDSREILSVNQSIDKNKLWIATNGDGIYLFDTKNNSFKQYHDKSTTGLKLQSNEVSLCYQDKKGNLWIVYRRIGLYVVPSKVTSGLLADKHQTAVNPVDANLLISEDSRINSYITTIYDDSEGRLWIGAWASLHVIEMNQAISNFTTTDDLMSNCKITCIYTEEMQDEMKFPISPVQSIIELKKTQFWLGLFGSGIIQIDEISKNRFSAKLPEINKKLPSKNIKKILLDSRNSLWIGTNSGICYYNPKTDEVKIITYNNGLSSDNINNIVEDKNSNLWVSTSYGISEIKSNNYSVLNYFYTDKEKLNQYIMNAGMTTSDGRICFSTNESLVFVNPDSVEIFKQNAPLYFTDIKIDNKTVTPLVKYNGTLVIDRNINECKFINVPYNHTLSIEFATLDYLHSSRFIYKYRIGNNSEWIVLNSNQRSLSLPNMNPGEYLLSIMLANTNNNNQIKSIKIYYMPPFWQSKPAIVLYFILLLTLFLTYRRLTIQRILQKSVIEKERYERKKLEELDKMKSEFFSNISHEFRTPLSLIINPLEKFVKDHEIPNKMREKLNLVLKSSNRLLKLTNELMDFSKIENRLFVPDFELCEMVSYIDEICTPFNNLADSMNIDFKLNSAFEQLEIPIDKGMIEKVVYNLLSNAFKFTPINGVVMVNISKYQEAEKEYIKISVINTGEGIEKENLTKIFDRFYQVNNIHNQKIEGTGIGLSLVKSFVEFHNGKIDVKSEPNIETTFTIYLPINQPDYIASNEFNTKQLSNIVTNLSLNSEIKITEKRPAYHYRLLLIEDEDDTRNYIVDELATDFKIISAKNGQEGITLANEIIPDLIITDVMMPVLSGIELCRSLKSQMSTSHIPIIILSAKASIDKQVEGLEMGADVYLIKPFNIDHLKTQILRLINFKENIYSRYLKETTLVPQGALVTKLDEEFMYKIMAFIEANLTNVDLSVDQLASCVALSKVQTYRKVKAISGMPVVEFIRTIRLKKAAQLVLEKRLNFTEIAFETGFSTPSYFSKCFHDHFGKSPSEFALDYRNK